MHPKFSLGGALTVAMIHKLSDAWKFPADLLVRPYGVDNVAQKPPRSEKSAAESAALGVDSVYRIGAPEEIRTPDPQIRSRL